MPCVAYGLDNTVMVENKNVATTEGMSTTSKKLKLKSVSKQKRHKKRDRKKRIKYEREAAKTLDKQNNPTTLASLSNKTQSDTECRESTLVPETQSQNHQIMEHPQNDSLSASTLKTIGETQDLDNTYRQCDYTTPRSSLFHPTPRSLESLLATQPSPGGNDGMKILVTSSMLPNDNPTPCEEKLTKAQQLLIEANIKITELTTNKEGIKSNLAAANAELLIRETEIEKLKDTIKRQKKDRSSKSVVTQLDDYKKGNKLLEEENTWLKGQLDSITIKKSTHTVITGKKL